MHSDSQQPQSKVNKIWRTAACIIVAVGLSLATLLLVGSAFFAYQNINPTVQIPKNAIPTPNAFDYFDRAAKQVKDPTRLSYALAGKTRTNSTDPLDRDYSLREKQQLANENQPALKTLQQGMNCAYGVPEGKWYMSSPYLRNLAELLALQSKIDENHGNFGAAMDDDLDAIEFGAVQPTNGGGLADLLQGDDCQSIGRRRLWNLIDRLNMAQTEAAIARMDRIAQKGGSTSDALLQEKWHGQRMLIFIFRDPNWRTIINVDPTADKKLRDLHHRQVAELYFVSKRTVMANYTAYMDNAILQSRHPYSCPQIGYSDPMDPVSSLMKPYNIGGAWFWDAKTETQNSLILVALALHAYQLDHGSNPDSLNALIPKYIQDVPADPFSPTLDKLRYFRTSKTYRLYSVGPDAIDDFGHPCMKTPPSNYLGEGAERYRLWIGRDSRGDIVSGINKG
jgi:hypothetical protein